jgi:transposase
MGAPYSQDLRERVISVVDGGMRAYEAAPLLRVSVSYIYKALGRRRATGETTARPSGRGPSAKLAPHDDALRQRIAEEPDATLEEIRAWLLATHGVKVSVGCLWKRLRHLGLPLKKSR